MLQLKPTIWLQTPKGVGLAHFIIDYGEEHDIIWGVCDDATGEWWWWPNTQVRAIKNISLGANRGQEATTGNAYEGPLPAGTGSNDTGTLAGPSPVDAKVFPLRLVPESDKSGDDQS